MTSSTTLSANVVSAYTVKDESFGTLIELFNIYNKNSHLSLR